MLNNRYSVNAFLGVQCFGLYIVMLKKVTDTTKIKLFNLICITDLKYILIL